MMLLVCEPEVVIFLNIFKSEGIFQGSLLFLPIPPETVRPNTKSNGIWRDAMIKV